MSGLTYWPEGIKRGEIPYWDGSAPARLGGGQSGYIPVWGSSGVPIWVPPATIAGLMDHGLLTNLVAPADHHTQYALLGGRAGGQTLIGGTAATNKLVLKSNSTNDSAEIELNSASGGAIGPQLAFYHESATPVAGDVTAVMTSYGKNSLAAKVAFGAWNVQAHSVVAGSETSSLNFAFMSAGVADAIFLTGVAPKALYPSADNTIALGTNGSRWANIYSVNSQADVFNALTGYRVNNAAALGNLLRGNGTNFVSAPVSSLASYAAWTPTVTQGGVVTSFTSNSSRYIQIGKQVTAHCYVIINNAGGAAAANVVTISLPVATTLSGVVFPLGSGWIFDASTGLFYTGVLGITGGSVGLVPTNAGAGNFLGALHFTAALATSDIVAFTVTYEVA